MKKSLLLVAAGLFLTIACSGKKSSGAAGDVLLSTGQNGDLVEINITNGAQTTVVHFSDASVLDPSISMDGGRIAFVRSPDFTTGQTDFGTDIYTAARDGSQLLPNFLRMRSSTVAGTRPSIVPPSE